MSTRFLVWAIGGAVAGSLIGVVVGKGNPWALVIVGSFGAFLGIAGFGVVCLSNGGSTLNRSKTNLFAIAGSLLGAVVGGYIGAVSNFGRVMIAIFNPGLPEMDFLSSFGAIGGAFIGAPVAACLFAAAAAWLRRGNEQVPPSEETDVSQE
jgi:hypothetical protein